MAGAYPNIGYLAQPAVRDRRALRLASQNAISAEESDGSTSANKPPGSPVPGAGGATPQAKNDICFTSISEASQALLDANTSLNKDKAKLALASISTIIISGVNTTAGGRAPRGRGNATSNMGVTASAHAGGYHTDIGRAQVAGGLLRELQQSGIIPNIAASLTVFKSERDLVLRACWALEELFRQVVQARQAFSKQCNGSALIASIIAEYRSDDEILAVCASLQYLLALIVWPRFLSVFIMAYTGDGCPSFYLRALQCTCFDSAAVAPAPGLPEDDSEGAAAAPAAGADKAAQGAGQGEGRASVHSPKSSGTTTAPVNMARRSSDSGSVYQGRRGSIGWSGGASSGATGAAEGGSVPAGVYTGRRKSSVGTRIIVYDAKNAGAPVREVNVYA